MFFSPLSLSLFLFACNGGRDTRGEKELLDRVQDG